MTLLTSVINSRNIGRQSSKPFHVEPKFRTEITYKDFLDSIPDQISGLAELPPEAILEQDPYFEENPVPSPLEQRKEIIVLDPSFSTVLHDREKGSKKAVLFKCNSCLLERFFSVANFNGSCPRCGSREMEAKKVYFVYLECATCGHITKIPTKNHTMGGYPSIHPLHCHHCSSTVLRIYFEVNP